MDVGHFIKNMRKHRNLTQRQLAAELFISYQLVSKWERNICEPSMEMMMDIIDKYQLPFDIFADQSISKNQKHTIIKAFIDAMLVQSEKMPTIQQVAQLAGLSINNVLIHFQSSDDLLYEFMVMLDKNIQKTVNLKISKNKNIINIFLDDMVPLLYQERTKLRLLYIRPYTKELWTRFITNKYKQILNNHKIVREISELDMDYIVGCLTLFISTWISQPYPEPLTLFQERVKRIVKGDAFSILFDDINYKKI